MIAYSIASSQETAAYNKALLSHINNAGYGQSPTHYPEMLNGVAWMTPFDFSTDTGYRLRGDAGTTIRLTAETTSPVTALDLSPLELCARACPNRRIYGTRCETGARVDRSVGDAKCTERGEYFDLPATLKFKAR